MWHKQFFSLKILHFSTFCSSQSSEIAIKIIIHLIQIIACDTHIYIVAVSPLIYWNLVWFAFKQEQKSWNKKESLMTSIVGAMIINHDLSLDSGISTVDLRVRLFVWKENQKRTNKRNWYQNSRCFVEMVIDPLDLFGLQLHAFVGRLTDVADPIVQIDSF